MERLLENGLLLISAATPAGAERIVARARIREALREPLAQRFSPAHVVLDSIPGAAPRLLIDGVPSAAGISISHADTLSVAAFNPHGAVGIDVMEVAQAEGLPDWRAVARDYLGAAAEARLAAGAPQQRARAFAQAWVEREARLKLFGLQLAEWTQLPVCRLETLTLPPGIVGTLALPF